MDWDEVRGDAVTVTGGFREANFCVVKSSTVEGWKKHYQMAKWCEISAS